MLKKLFSVCLAISMLLTILGVYTFGVLKVYAAPITYYVDKNNPNASDTNPGTSALPWKTISKAASTITAGDTVIVRAGTYRETIIPANGGNDSSSKISYLADPGVYVTGADLIPSDGNWWLQDSGKNIWRHAWTTNLTFTVEPYLYDDTLPDLNYKVLPQRRDMFIVDGEVYEPKAYVADLVPGTFTLDNYDDPVGTAPQYLYIRFPSGVTPSGHTVEGSTRGSTLNAQNTNWLYFKGFTFTHAANAYHMNNVNLYNTSYTTLEYCNFVWNNTNGVSTGWSNCHDNIYRYCIVSDNGQIGFSGSGTNTLIESCTIERNNRKGFNMWWEAGGSKFSGASGLTLRNVYSKDNYGVGIWFDIDNVNCLVENSIIAMNQGAGLMLELNSNYMTVKNNIIYGTHGGAGIFQQAANHNTIVNNTIYGNDGQGIWLHLDPRADCTYNKIYNNIIGYNCQSPDAPYNNGTEGLAEIAIEEANQAYVRTNILDGNLYYHQPGANGYTFFNLYGWGNYHHTDSLGTWQSWMLSDYNSSISDPLLMDSTAESGWHLTSESPAIGMGVTPPVTVSTDYDGDSRPSTGADVGADQYSSGEPTPTDTLLATINNNDAGITYSGSWTYQNNRGYGDYNDDVHYGTGSSEYFTYTFNGTGVEYIAEKNTDQGQVKIYIDDQLQQTVDCYNATRLAQQTIYSKRDLTNGSHTIKVQQNTGTYAICDALKIYGPSNIIQNPGFESGTTSWFGSGCTISATSSQYHSGTKSCQASSRSATWAGVMQSVTPLINSKTYTVSAWVKLASGTDNSNIYAQIVVGGNTYYRQMAHGTVNSSGWTHLSGQYTFNESGTITSSNIYVDTGTLTVDVYTDDFSLTQN